MRTKEVVIDDAQYRIGALTIAQVEEFLAEQQAALQNTATAEAMAHSWRKFVAQGLTNALNGNSSIAPWTEERVLTDLDLPSFEKLRTEILTFSGLRLITPEAEDEKKKPPSEVD